MMIFRSAAVPCSTPPRTLFISRTGTGLPRRLMMPASASGQCGTRVICGTRITSRTRRASISWNCPATWKTSLRPPASVPEDEPAIGSASGHLEFVGKRSDFLDGSGQVFGATRLLACRGCSLRRSGTCLLSHGSDLLGTGLNLLGGNKDRLCRFKNGRVATHHEFNVSLCRNQPVADQLVLGKLGFRGNNNHLQLALDRCDLVLDLAHIALHAIDILGRVLGELANVR